MVCVLVALVAALVWTLPAAAQPERGLPMSWSSFAGSVIDWATGVWRMMAGSGTEAPAEEPGGSDPEGLALDGLGETLFGKCEPEGDKFPGVDPDG